jgi:exodeoxyribonuclease VII small subunit
VPSLCPNGKETQVEEFEKGTAMSQPAKSDKPEPFEKNLARLDAIVRELEDTELPLDKALVLYEEGMKLSDFCHKQLEEAEGRVEIMTKKAGGKIVAEPFEAGDGEE